MGEKAEGGKERRGAEAGGALLFFLFFFGLLFAIGISFLIGRYPVGPGTVLRMLLFRLFGVPGNWNKAELTVVLDIRLPRLLAAMLVGSALAISGAAYQGIFKNPMVSPDILGASAGRGSERRLHCSSASPRPWFRSRPLPLGSSRFFSPTA